MSHVKPNRRRKSVTISVDQRRWRGLEFEAELLTSVFGHPTTAEDVLQSALEETLRRRTGGRGRR